MDIATKTGMGAANITSKRVVSKLPEATGDLIGNKIADKITSLGSTKSKKRKMEKKKKKKNKKSTYHQKKDSKLLMT